MEKVFRVPIEDIFDDLQRLVILPKFVFLKNFHINVSFSMNSLGL